MTNIEIMQQQAVKMLDAQLLNAKESEFIQDIRDYSKKLLKKLTPAQYRFLDTIVEKYKNKI